MPSLQEINKQRQRSNFVGREEQIDAFYKNLDFSLQDKRRRFIFNVWGQGGVGKSTLLKQFRKIAEEAKIVTALIDEAERSAPEAMGRFAQQLEEKGYKLGQFSERYKVYRQKKQELEADPEAPQGFSAFVGKSLAKTGMKLGRHLPGAGVALEFVDEEGMATQAGEWATYVAKKLGNKDEVRLIQEPVDVLTPLFLRELDKVAEKTKVALFFDTYECTDDFLDRWLREVFAGRYGEVSDCILWIIAGRQELEENRWADYEGLMARLPLEPFTEEEAKQYLARKGITNSRVIETILSLSGRLPLLVATLAAESPNDPEKVGDPSGTAVERFLKWVDDPKRRQVALDAALARGLNRDILAQLNGKEEADKLFDWLREMPFVEEHPQGWKYHDVVRMQMLHRKRLTSPQGWAELQGKLVDYYDALRKGLALEEAKQQRDETWQGYTLEVLYHCLCQAPQKQLPVALNEFLAALKEQGSFARKWAETMERAGKDVEVAEVRRWGERLVEGLTAYDEERYEVTVSLFAELVKCSEVEEQWKAVALAWRGETYRLMGRYEDALRDFDKAIAIDSEYKWAIASRGETYRLMERYEEALKDFDRAIELDPQYEWAIANRGNTYFLMKRYEEALKDYDRAIEFDPKDDWAIANRGFTCQKMGRYEQALKDFDKVMELDPEYDCAIERRGVTHRKMGRYEKAFEDFDKAIELDSECKRTIGHQGQTYRLMERYEEALKDLNRAIELDPKDDWAIGERGRTYRKMGRYEEALKDFDKVIELDPQDDWAIVQRGITYREMGRYEKMLKDFDRVIELEPEDSLVIVSRSYIYLILQRYAEALADLKRASQLDFHHIYLYNRAIAYRALNQPGKARTDFQRAIQLAQQTYNKNPEYWRNTFNLALYFLASGNSQQAKHFYRDAITRGAPSRHIQIAIYGIGELLRIFPQHKGATAARRALNRFL
ncbi:MAG: tetratricopeptide repeat protein [Cyanobacteriota bacterium]|nr:tetratricopeptide repeat protein [Cyanobacteriota bacterium]